MRNVKFTNNHEVTCFIIVQVSILMLGHVLQVHRLHQIRVSCLRNSSNLQLGSRSIKLLSKIFSSTLLFLASCFKVHKLSLNKFVLLIKY